MQRLAGRWIGTYEYAEPDSPGPRRVSFELTLLDGSPWRLTGDIRDDPEAGMDDTATVRGWTFGRWIWFRKTYPVAFVRADPKPLPLADHIRATYGESMVGEPGPQVVSYRGRIGPDEASMSGRWSLPAQTILLASTRVTGLPFSSGTWQMRRA